MWIFDEFGNLVFVENTRFSRAMDRVNKKDPGDGGEGGGGSGGEGDGDGDSEKILADAKAAIAEAAALREKNSTLLNEKKTLSGFQKTIESLGGSEALAALKEFKEKIENDEILKLASEGKHDEAIKRATEKVEVRLNAEKTELENKVTETEQKYNQLNENFTKLVIDSVVAREYLGEKGFETAVDDAVFRARQVFVVEDGQPVARDKDGNLVQGEKGALTVKEWINNYLKKTAPHLFPNSNGTGRMTGSDDVDSFASSLLEAAKKGPAFLRAEKERQAKIMAGKK